MIIKCLANKDQLLRNDPQLRYSSSNNEPIIVGKEYLVYALTQNNNYIEYCIYEENGFSIPIWCTSTYFEIINPRLSRYWIFSFLKDTNNQNRLFLGFPEWANDEYFYDSLTEGYEKECDIFKAYRQLMDLEFPNNSITDKAQVGDEKWLICPTCFDAWENTDKKNALVICPKCKKTYCNPRYTDQLPSIFLGS